MERKLTREENCHVKVEVVVDEATWKKAQDKAYNKLIKNVKVDGFRPGKAPAELAKKHVDMMKMFDEAINSLLPDIYRDIINEEKLEPFAQPKVDVTSLSDTSLTVTFVITTAPEVKLGQYKDLKIGKKEAKVTAKDVDAAIDELRNQNGSLVLKEDAAALGDTVILDFVGTIDGVAFDGGSSENYSLELGSGTFIPGFEDQLVGVKAGESKDVKVTFPKAYQAELAGKDAVFACTVHEVKTKKVPELDDEFVKDLGLEGISTVKELKDSKKKELLEAKERENKNEYLRNLYETIAKNSTVAIPQEMIDEQVEKMKRDMEQRMAQSGLTLDQYLQFVGQKLEDFEAKLAEDAKKDITNYFVLLEVGKAEKFELSEEEIEFELAKLGEENGKTLEEVKQLLGNRLGQFKENLTLTKLEELLLAQNQ